MLKIKLKKLWGIAALVFLGIGLFIRFWWITDNQFFFYDEGMYLGYNRNFLNLVANNPPKDIHELFLILGLMVKTALGTAKALWFFVLNLRVFILGPEAWYFSRLVSAFSGIATIALTYFFAYRYFQSRRIAMFSALTLMILPSHVFYSRLGMQESLSALLFLAALYIYVFYRKNNWAVVLSALLLVCVYWTNYRMIISPIFILAIELWESYKNQKVINWKKLILGGFTFGVVVFFVGSLYHGINREVTFGWMSHQAQEAQGQRNLMNFLSYPYYVFALEGLIVGLIFWSNLYLVFQKQWSKLLPFILVLLQMGIFSLAAEKGARYLCVVLPFMAIAVAVALENLLSFEKYKKYILTLAVLASLLMFVQSLRIVMSSTDYEKAIDWVQLRDPNAGILSTQPLVEQLYVRNERMVQEAPRNLVDLINLYQQGFRYLIVDPQAYISWTKDKERFTYPLIDFMEFIVKNVPPVIVFDHLNSVLLERFVLDHNQNLTQSLKFLSNTSKEGFNRIRVFDIGQCLLLLKKQAMEKI